MDNGCGRTTSLSPQRTGAGLEPGGMLIKATGMTVKAPGGMIVKAGGMIVEAPGMIVAHRLLGRAAVVMVG